MKETAPALAAAAVLVSSLALALGARAGLAEVVPRAAPPAVAGTITGTVSFTGQAPEAQVIQMAADPFCQAAHADAPARTERVVVNSDGSLRWAFVRVTEGLPAGTPGPPAEPVLLDQQGCIYAPHVLGVQAGQPIQIRNSDTTLHNVHALSENNPDFNIAQPIQGMTTTRTFENPEVMVSVKCDVHPWMASYIGVVEHPYFAVTDDTGGFTIPDLPPGDYVLEVWHEALGTQTRNVTVTDGATASVEFTLGG